MLREKEKIDRRERGKRERESTGADVGEALVSGNRVSGGASNWWKKRERE